MKNNLNIDSDKDYKKKTVSMTFRIDEDIMDKLREEANSQDLTLNMLLNHILTKFVEWDVFVPKIGMIPISKPIVIEIFKKLNDQDISDIAKVGKETVRDMALFMKGRLNPQTFFSWYQSRMKNSSIEIRHSQENNIDIFAVKHDLGINWSKYHRLLLESIFLEIFKQPIEVEISKTTVIFRTKK